MKSLPSNAMLEDGMLEYIVSAFKAKGNKDSINALILWSEEIAKHDGGTRTHDLF